MKAIAGILLVTTVAAASDFTPARRVGGVSPPLPSPTVVGWLEEVVGLAVDASGLVRNIKALRSTTNPPNLVGAVAATWRFRPAAVGGRPVSSYVLAIALIRPPQLFDAPTPGAEPTTFAAVPDDLPAPTVMHRPRYPPLAVGDSLVLVEVLVDPDGHVRAADIAQGTTAVFNDEALFTARNWVFRPAHRNGEPVSAYAYIAFGFRQPIEGGDGNRSNAAASILQEESRARTAQWNAVPPEVVPGIPGCFQAVEHVANGCSVGPKVWFLKLAPVERKR